MAWAVGILLKDASTGCLLYHQPLRVLNCEFVMSGKDFLTKLPVEILSDIFAYLPGEDVAKCSLLSKYCYETVAYGVPFSALELLGYRPIDLSWSTEFTLNILTNKSKRCLPHLDILSVDSKSLCEILTKFPITSLQVTDNDYCHEPMRILSAFRNLNSMDALCKFHLTVEYQLSLNELQVLAVMAANLESLEIYCKMLKKELYVGKKRFLKLQSFKIFIDEFEDDDDSDEFNSDEGFRARDTPPTRYQAFESLLKKIPKLTNLNLMGRFFGQDYYPTLPSMNELDLKSIGVDLYGVDDPRDCLPKINESVTELYINALRVGSHRDNPPNSPLANVDTFYFSGEGVINVLDYYQIGTNLKKLLLKPSDPTPKAVYKAVVKCPNLEHLVVLNLTVTIDWIFKLEVPCPRLTLVCFDSIQYTNRAPTGLRASSIKDIYLVETTDYSLVEALSQAGFNVYNGQHSGFDINIAKFQEKDVWSQLDHMMSSDSSGFFAYSRY